MSLLPDERDSFGGPSVGASFVTLGGALGTPSSGDATNLTNIPVTNAMSVAWTTYTPTITTAAGSITTLGTVTGHYFKIGRMVWIRVVINITTNGTGASSIRASLPFTGAAYEHVLSSKETLVTGVGGIAFIPVSGTYVQLGKYDATYPGANGYRLVTTGVYEAVS